MDNESALLWPAADFSRVPYAVYSLPEVFDREQDKIFRGPIWCYLALEAEIPNPGDYLTTFIGDTPIIVNRADNGTFHAFVNRCSHRGTLLAREKTGHTQSHICVYHNWSFDLRGNLTGVPFQRGMRGSGGMPDTFNKDDHGLRTLRVGSYAGVIFGSFATDPEPIEDYLDEPMRGAIDNMFHKPIEVLGYLRQRVPGNWKHYFENLNDLYHAGLLHRFNTIFGVYRNTQRGGTIMDKFRRHRIGYSVHESDDDDTIREGYRDTEHAEESIRLKDDSMLEWRDEIGNSQAIMIMPTFPNVVFQQIFNTLATRQIRPRAPNEFDLYWTFFGYADDDSELRDLRLNQANMIGPAGLISMEDSEAGALAQRAVHRERDAYSVIEMGGVGPIDSQETLLTEVPIRGFWRYYCHLMEYPVEGGLPWPPTA